MRPFVVVCLVLSALTAACGGGADSGFDSARARAHLEMLAGTIGRRPAGTEANARARAYLVDQLAALGFVVRVQEADAVDERTGVTARVRNIIASRDGVENDAIALVAHYDSIPDGPGALDNAMAVACAVEAARVLVSGSGLTHGLFVVLTDAEEFGLMGARAAVRDPEIRRRVRAWINFDATGADGPAYLFETTGGDALLAWARGAASPRGASWAMEIYRRLPNDTDFSVIKPLGATGVNIATVADAYPYHTDRDRPARVTDRALRHEGVNTVTTVRALDRTPLDVGEIPNFLDLAGRRAFVFSAGANRVLTDLAIVAGGTAWLSMLALLWRTDRPRRILITTIWAAIVAGASAGALVGAAGALRAVRPERQPWYAHPDPFLVFMSAAALLTALMVLALARRVPERWRPLWSVPAIWMLSLPVWVTLAILANREAPATAFLLTLPLLAASVPLAVPFGRPGSIVAAGILSLLVVALLWWPGFRLLLRFVVPMFGWLPVVTPVWIYPALMVAIAVTSLPPCLAVVVAAWPRARAGRAHLVAAAVVLAVVIGSAVMAVRADAYDADHPVRRSVRYVQDAAGGRAWWEIAANEPGLDVSAGGPNPAAWRASRDPLPAALPVTPLAGPFRSWIDATPEIAAAPLTLDVASRADGPGRTRWSLSIVPHELMAVRVMLPRGVTPLESSWRGAVAGGVWSATFVGLPPEGGTLDLTMAESAGPLDAAVVGITDHLPGAPAGERLPAWLDTRRTAWTARSWYVVSTRDRASRAASASATPSAPPAPSRR